MMILDKTFNSTKMALAREITNLNIDVQHPQKANISVTSILSLDV